MDKIKLLSDADIQNIGMNADVRGMAALAFHSIVTAEMGVLALEKVTQRIMDKEYIYLGY